MAMDRFRRALASPTVDIIVRSAVVVSLVVTALLAWRLQNLVSCVAHYNDINNQRMVILGAAAEEERDAERKADEAQAALFLSPALSKDAMQRTPAEIAELRRLFVAYQKALTEQTSERREADRARTEHPVPDPPKDVCGSVAQPA